MRKTYQNVPYSFRQVFVATNTHYVQDFVTYTSLFINHQDSIDNKYIHT